MRAAEQMTDRLERLGVLVSPRVRDALLAVDLRAFLPKKYEPLAYLEMPVPFHDADRVAATTPSPRFLALVLQLLDVDEGHHVLVLGPRSGYVAALLQELALEGRVRAVEEDGALSLGTRRALDRAGYPQVELSAAAGTPVGDGWDRVLLTSFLSSAPRELARLLADLGHAVAPLRRPHGYELSKVVKGDGGVTEIAVSGLPAGLSPPFGGPADRVHALDLGRLLAVEELMRNVWEGNQVSGLDRHFLHVVEDTWAPEADVDLPPEALDRRRVAMRVFHAAYVLQSVGDLSEAVDVYRASVDLFPSAEGHTFLGWTYSFLGRVDEAIEECKKAIGVDPGFGNPYNDIGAYLIEKGDLDDAIPWLQEALEAPRYCCPFYAHSNLGRVYMLQGRPQLARREFLAALQLNPEYEVARELLKRVDRGSDYIG